jgi:hypothetical protein
MFYTKYVFAFFVAGDIKMAFCCIEMVIRLLELQGGINNRRTRHGIALNCIAHLVLFYVFINAAS